MTATTPQWLTPPSYGGRSSPTRLLPSWCHGQTLMDLSTTLNWNWPVFSRTTMCSPIVWMSRRSLLAQVQTILRPFPGPPSRQYPPRAPHRISFGFCPCTSTLSATNFGHFICLALQIVWRMTARASGTFLTMNCLLISILFIHSPSLGKSPRFGQRCSPL